MPSGAKESAWELRQPGSFRLLKGKGRFAEARDLIRPVLARIVARQPVADVTEARLLLSSLQHTEPGRLTA